MNDASTLARSMPALWGVAPGGTLDSLSCGIAATRLRACGPKLEVQGPAMPVHIVSWVLRGEADHRIRNDGRLVHRGAVPSRSVNVVVAGVQPRAVISQMVDVLHVYLPAAWLDQQAEAAGLRGAELLDPRSSRDPVLDGLMPLLLQAMHQAAPADRLLADTLGQAVGLHMLRRWSTAAGRSSQVPQGGLAPRQLREVCDYIQQHLDRNVSLAELASLAGLSTWHFCRAFKQSTGAPPHQWLLARRMERACERLARTDLPVTAIAAAIGYEDPGQFATTFRTATGQSPSQYRRHTRS